MITMQKILIEIYEKNVDKKEDNFTIMEKLRTMTGYLIHFDINKIIS